MPADDKPVAVGTALLAVVATSLALYLLIWAVAWFLAVMPHAAFGAEPTPLVPPEYRTGLTNDLCLGGRPRKRPPACERSAVPGCLTYGGLPERHGFERDHFIPEALCRGQSWCDVAVPDPTRPPSSTNPGNVWYQRCDRFYGFRCVEGPAATKETEESEMIGGYCGGRVSLPEAYAQIRKDWGQ